MKRRNSKTHVTRKKQQSTMTPLCEWTKANTDAVNVSIQPRHTSNRFGIGFNVAQIPKTVKKYYNCALNLTNENVYKNHVNANLFNFANMTDKQVNYSAFLSLINSAFLQRNAPTRVEKKLDALAYRVACDLAGFSVAPFIITYETLQLKLGINNYEAHPDMLVVKHTQTGKLMVIVFEEKDRKNYTGKHGIYQLCGEMIAALQFNYKLVHKQANYEMLGVRLVAEMVTFFYCFSDKYANNGYFEFWACTGSDCC